MIGNHISPIIGDIITSAFGGGTPVFPTAGNVGYYSAEAISNLGFSSANSVNFINDQSSASNDLTQGTASANPLFIEHDTVKQFTLANQPMLKYDKEVSQDTSVNQPTLVDVGGGELVIDVNGSSKYFNNFPFINDGDFVIEYIIDAVFDTQSTFTHRIGNDYIRFRETGVDINNPTGGQGFTQFFFGQTLSNGEYLLKIKRSVDDVSVYLEGVQVDVTKTIAGVWSIPQILGSTHTTNGGAFKRVSLWNSDDDSGTPDFELLPDPTTMRKDDGTQPIAGDLVQGWHATGAELAINFPVGNANLAGYDNPTDDFTFEWDGTFLDDDDERFLQASTSANTRCLYNGNLSIASDDTSGITFTGIPDLLNTRAKVIFRKTGNSMECFVDGVSYGTQDVTGKTYYLFDTIGYSGFSRSANCNLFSFRVYGESIADPNNITEVPRWEFLPTEESCNVLAGQQVSRWNATSHKPWLNRLLSDGNDDHLEGMAVQTGDFTYMFKLAFNALSTTEYIFSHTTGLSAVVLLSDNYIYLRDTTGANDIGLTGHTVELGEHVYTLTREGNSLKYYVDSCLKDTIDVTGRTFELDTFGRPTDSLADLTADWGVWNRALTKEELDYFSYLRSEDTNEILLPPLTPDCP